MKKGFLYKVGSLVLALLLCFSLILTVGCSGGQGKPAGGDSGSSAGAGKNLPDRDAILIGWVAPFTGPLAQFTQSVKFVEEKALAIINKDGGIFIEDYGKKLPIKIIWADSESNPTKASEAATKLVLNDKVDFLIGSWTPDTINPVSAVAERYKVPALMENGPIDSWLTGGPYHWAFGNLFDLRTMMTSYVDAWDTAETNKKIGFIYDNGVDGVVFSALNREIAEARGYTIIDPGRFPAGTKDYTAIISQFKAEGVDIVAANMITPDFGVLWNQFHQQGFIPKIMNIGKAMHFTADVAALGEDMGVGLLSEDMWAATYPYKSALTGQTAAELTADWEEYSGKPADCTLGYDWSTFEVINDVFTRAKTLDKEKVRQALAETDLDTAYGRIKYDERNISVVPVVTSQWKKGTKFPYEKNIVSNTNFPEIPLSEEKLFFIPGSK